MDDSTGPELKTPEEPGGDGPSSAGSDARSADPTRATDASSTDPAEGSDVDAAVVEEFEHALADANRRADENWDRYLRAEAELDNYKRMAERRRSEAVGHEKRRLLAAFLAVADNLERALSHSGSDPDALLAGVEATLRALRQVLEKEGVSIIDALESDFDPTLHEAVGVVAVPGIEGEKVVAVEQPGYTMGDDLLRPARVIVGRPPDDGAS